jgi:hypothetical protein
MLYENRYYHLLPNHPFAPPTSYSLSHLFIFLPSRLVDKTNCKNLADYGSQSVLKH